MKKQASKGMMYKGLSRKNPSGDSGMRAGTTSTAKDATREKVGRGHSIGGRTA